VQVADDEKLGEVFPTRGEARRAPAALPTLLIDRQPPGLPLDLSIGHGLCQPVDGLDGDLAAGQVLAAQRGGLFVQQQLQVAAFGERFGRVEQLDRQLGVVSRDGGAQDGLLPLAEEHLVVLEGIFVFFGILGILCIRLCLGRAGRSPRGARLRRGLRGLGDDR